MRIVNGVVFGFLLVIFFIWLGASKKKEKECRVFELFIRKHLYIFGILLLANGISFGMTFVEEKGEIYVEREGYGGQEKQIDLLLEKGETTEQITLNVAEQKLTKEERKKKMEEAFAYLTDHIKGKNDSLTEVTESLDFSIDYEKYPFDVEFQPEDYSLIDGDGNLKNEKKELLSNGYGEESLLEGVDTKVTVILWYGEANAKKTYELTVFPKKENGVEKLFAGVLEELEKTERKTSYKEGFSLPVKIDGVKITRIDQGGITPFHVFIIGMVFAGLLLLRERENVRQAEHRRKEQLQRCYPWFVNELVLLLGAGMQVKNIIYVLLREHEKEEDLRPLMEELNIAKNSMEIGMSEEQVYYQLGRRLKLPCYIKLMTLLEQNVKRGGKGLTAIFEQEELAALEERKNLAKRYGEEAGTKLLGPMILLLLVIMCMIMIPAFLGF